MVVVNSFTENPSLVVCGWHVAGAAYLIHLDCSAEGVNAPPVGVGVGV